MIFLAENGRVDGKNPYFLREMIHPPIFKSMVFLRQILAQNRRKTPFLTPFLAFFSLFSASQDHSFHFDVSIRGIFGSLRGDFVGNFQKFCLNLPILLRKFPSSQQSFFPFQGPGGRNFHKK